jgi:hypothetical protein
MQESTTMNVPVIKFFVATLSALVLIAQPVLADSPHFTNGSAKIVSTPSIGSLAVSFQEAGLGNDTTVFIQANAQQTATWGCINHGSNHPQGLDTRTTPVSSPSEPFTAGRNGGLKGTVTIPGPSGPPDNFTCPASNMTVVLVGVSYTDVTVTDSTSPAGPFSITGTFSITFFK